MIQSQPIDRYKPIGPDWSDWSDRLQSVLFVKWFNRNQSTVINRLVRLVRSDRSVAIGSDGELLQSEPIGPYIPIGPIGTDWTDWYLYNIQPIVTLTPIDPIGCYRFYWRLDPIGLYDDGKISIDW
jgi:hypothetical protein